MSKYSLQNECLENIEAFSDEQMNREMAVIESVLEIYDKTILMMELSNADVDIPDCSMFMESTFFQEDETPPTGNAQPANGGEGGTTVTNGGQSAPTAQDGQQQNNGQTGNNTQKTPPTEAERKKYNSEHQFRQMNKKGNTENMFISIIAFIPRLLGFLVQCIVKLFKKLFNIKSDEAIKKSDDNLKNLTDEQKQQIASEQGDTNSNNDNQAAGSDNAKIDGFLGKLDVVKGTYKWWEPNSIKNYLEEVRKALESLNFKDRDNFVVNCARINPTLMKLIDSSAPGKPRYVEYQDVPGNILVQSKNDISQKLTEVQKLAETKSNEAKDFKTLPFKISDNGKALATVKTSIKYLKDVIKNLTRYTNEFYNGIVEATKAANAVNSVANDQSTEPPVNNEGGENNGGQEQNNPANT